MTAARRMRSMPGCVHASHTVRHRNPRRVRLVYVGVHHKQLFALAKTKHFAASMQHDSPSFGVPAPPCNAPPAGSTRNAFRAATWRPSHLAGKHTNMCLGALAGLLRVLAYPWRMKRRHVNNRTAARLRGALPAALNGSAALTLAVVSDAQQVVDTAFRPTVAKPAYPSHGPLVRIDEAHKNSHTMFGTYPPFAELLRRDGYRVEPNKSAITAASLRSVSVLVIANATAAGENPDERAFTADEVTALRQWVEQGGSLLLIADHAPFGAAANALAREFGVEMSKGMARDTASPNRTANPTFLRFSRDNGLLGDHSITRGRSDSEHVDVVMTFSGQSLSVPAGAAALLKLSATAEDRVPPSAEQRAARAQRLARLRDSIAAAVGARADVRDTVITLQPPEAERVAAQFTSAAGRAQGLALTVGRGRAVILGEAAMLSAQVVELPARAPIRMGMNVPHNDNQQFALNVMRWLSRLLE